MRRLWKWILIVVLAGGGFAGWLVREFRTPYKGYSQDKIFVDIPRGRSRRAIASILAQNGVVHSRIAFEILTRLHLRQSLEAGEYEFVQPMTPREVFDRLAAGRVYIHTMTIPEGWTMFDIAIALEREGLCRREQFLAAVRDPSLIRDIAPDAQTLDGFLFPATYEFAKHSTPEQLAAAMVQRFRFVWASLPGVGHDTNGDPTGLPGGMNIEQVVTMASLVERETPSEAERPIVAGVFYNRLARRLPLQCDPTVLYAMDLAGHYTHILKPADLRFNSPYNTYAHAGLPPGPIANPGESSLRAAIAPASVPFLFFVANTEGGHFFSKTLAEHNHNVARYRRLLQGLTNPPQGVPPPGDPPKKRKGRS
jgi:UPF0755 protein